MRVEQRRDRAQQRPLPRKHARHLAAVPAAAAAACVAELRALGYADAAVIGEVVGPADADGGDLVECRVWSGL